MSPLSPWRQICCREETFGDHSQQRLNLVSVAGRSLRDSRSRNGVSGWRECLSVARWLAKRASNRLA
jgi:hypothetical protein